MSIYLVPPCTPSHKPSFTHNLHHFSLNQCWVPHQDSTALEHESAVLKEPPHISGDHFGKVAEERMDFRGAILSYDQPLLTKTDIILDKELVGQPISLQESDYTPAIPVSPSHISHPYPSMWMLTQPGVSKNDHLMEDIKLERGSPIHLFDLNLSLRREACTSLLALQNPTLQQTNVTPSSVVSKTCPTPGLLMILHNWISRQINEQVHACCSSHV